MQKRKNNEINEMNDDWGSIGIGAMIVFIALILVAAVASAVIIQTGEKLQQNAQQTGSDTQQEISGKISIITVWVGDQAVGAEEITIVFELAPGSEPMANTDVFSTVICDNTGAGQGVNQVQSDFAAATDLDDATGAGPFTPGSTYMIHVDVSGAGTAGCEPALNAEHQLLITANGGGTTYETLYYKSTDEGEAII
jgi:archaellin